ncbi:TetR/AcrR family transcriptional regulator [Paenibacillus daejeonensis]|uniref:TetR/AcrR family transcriptional regulator n=1 Tax=Paenibacillus daejeonensis TaxID=135193 RepID=UPI000378D26A|nr:TetR/AcrR family transcriptional regulator [Paenibacillus daejeonensis]
MRRTKEDASETNRQLLDLGRTYFGEKGYADASMEELVKEAGLTRGALYHHFGSKQGLFEAVLASVQQTIGERVAREAEAGTDPWDELMRGCRAFMTAAVEPVHRRILLIDGPAVLGWEVWRRMDEEHAMRHLKEQLQQMQEAGWLLPIPVEAMAHLLSGAMNEAVLWLAALPEYEQELEQTMVALEQLMSGIRVR